MRIEVSENNGNLWFSARDKERNLFSRGSLSVLSGIEAELVRLWLFNMAKTIFPVLPIDEPIPVALNQSIKDKYPGPVTNFCDLIEITNSYLIQVRPPTLSNKNRNILFYNVSDDLRYASLCDLIRKRAGPLGATTFYKSLDLGFDREKREWIKGLKKIPPPEEFFAYLEANNIGMLITINSYLMDSFMAETGCHIVPVMKKMGVKLIRIRNDPPDLAVAGYFREQFHYDEDTVFFSNLQCLTQEWQTNCNIGAVTYVAIPQDYSKKFKIRLRDDYKIIVLSNSRWESAKAWTASTRAILAELANPYTDLTAWYMAMRQLNLETDMKPRAKEAINSMIHQFFFVAAQELKFMVLENLIPSLGRPLEVYGDIGWKNVCEAQYRGSLDNAAIEKLFEREDIVFLLMNCSYTYLDASGPVYDMMRRGVHWVNVPPVVKTRHLEGLSNIEYRSNDDLVSLLTNAREPFEKASESLEYYRGILESSVDTIVGAAVTDGHISKGLRFSSSQNMHARLMKDKIDNYIADNEHFLRVSMRTLFADVLRKWAT